MIKVFPVLCLISILSAGCSQMFLEGPQGMETVTDEKDIYVYGAGSTLKVFFTSDPPVIDGELNDTCWKDVHERIGCYIDYKSGKSFINKKEYLKICFDDEALYLACWFPHLQPGTHTGDGIWEDDGPDLFFDTTNSDEAAYQIFINSKGQWGDIYNDFSGAIEDQNYTAKGIKAVGTADTLEIKIPFSTFSYKNTITLPKTTKAPRHKEVWGANFSRSYIDENRIEQFYNWSGLMGSSHQPDLFNDIIFIRE